jgi:hypothetical protein
LNIPNSSDRKAVYQNEMVRLAKVIAWRDRVSAMIGLGRGILFLIAVLCIIGSLTGILIGAWAYIIPSLPLVILIILAAYHETILDRQILDRNKADINHDQIHRIEHNWSKLSEPKIEIPPERFHLCKDLDLFGQASLFKILSITKTPLGVRTLAGWMMNPADPDQIQKRQQAVNRLTDQLQLREELQLLAKSVADSRTDPDHLLEWAKGSLWLEKRPGLRYFTRVSSCLMLGLLIGFFLPGAPRIFLGGASLGLLLVHFGLTAIFSGSIHGIFNSVGYRQRDVSNYFHLFLLSRKLPEDCELLESIRNQLSSGDHNAVICIKSLQRIIGIAQMRRNGLMFLVYLCVQFLFMIDFHTLSWLEKWHKQNAERVQHWLWSLAEWEALTSLSNLAFHHPEWTFPKIDQRLGTLTAFGLGHPLINGNDRVCNNVTVGPTQTILLVTGSNMSGKSTLLRSIGLNAILAQMGSAVCAGKMEMPSVQIETSMRIGDSVSDGISFFMAELKRLRQITVEAENLKQVPGKTLLFLLDEILQGTNSRERQIAVVRVCHHLLESQAIGAISTHDLELAEAPEISNRVQAVHFREFFETSTDGKNEMKFDYLMREGVSPTTNALKLLTMVGLDTPKPSE